MMQDQTFNITTQLDLIRAKQLLASHTEQLEALTDERAKWYTNSIIGKIKEAIEGCNLIEAFNDGDKVVFTVNPTGKTETGIIRNSEYRTMPGRCCYIAVGSYEYAQNEVLTIKRVV